MVAKVKWTDDESSHSQVSKQTVVSIDLGQLNSEGKQRQYSTGVVKWLQVRLQRLDIREEEQW